MFRILGCYRPLKWEAMAIGKDLVQFTQDMGIIPLKLGWDGPWHVVDIEQANSASFASDVRGPAGQPTKDDMVQNWHSDGHAGRDEENRPRPMSLVLWSSETPTEFLLPSGEIVVPEPYEIVLADNLKVKHRMPKVIGKGRWFFRQAVRTPD